MTACVARALISLIAVAALYGLPWVSVAPNRLLPGRPAAAIEALGNAAVASAGMILAAVLIGARREAAWMSLGLLMAAAATLLVATGATAADLLSGSAPSARVMLGAGFWVAVTCLAALMQEQARRTSLWWTGPLAVVAVAAMLLLGGVWGLFDRLSLMVEYRARMSAVHAAIGQHLVLSAAAVVLALAVAASLSWAAYRSGRTETIIGAALGAFQVIPAIALFGMLIPLLAAILNHAPRLRALGLTAIGPAPAVIGVALYVALPLLRGIVGGLRAADAAVVEAARAMGMTESRLLFDVRVPLGLPVLASALRVAVVQSVGLMALAGLIGGGGLGAIVFEGMSQLAPDLILLGSLPIIALAVAADRLLTWAGRPFERLR